MGWSRLVGSQPGPHHPHGRHEHGQGGARPAQEEGRQVGDGEEGVSASRPGRENVGKVRLLALVFPVITLTDTFPVACD